MLDRSQITRWQDIAPADAVDIVLPWDGIEGPINELGERCPWPWDPQQLVGAPLGQYHCGYCGGMQVAGTEHLDWSPCAKCGHDIDWELDPANHCDCDCHRGRADDA